MLENLHLPTVNASLNALSAVWLLTGLYFIRRDRIVAHRAAMTAAFSCSVLFLISYLIYHFQVGSVKFQGTGGIRTFYLSMLATHTVLAAAVPFLAVITLARAVRGRIEQHRALARWTLQIWLYVSLTGVMIYWMLYRM